jgi:hypothetical protein
LKNKENTDIVLVPQPSDDVNDPLNWPKWKKIVAFISIAILTALTGWIIVALSPAIVLLEEDFHTSLNETATLGITWCVFALGIGVSDAFNFC